MTHKDAQVVHPSASHPPDLAIYTSKQGDKSRLTHKDAQVVHPSASHPPDLAICTSKQGDKSTFTHKDAQVVHHSGPDEKRVGRDEEAVPRLVQKDEQSGNPSV